MFINFAFQLANYRKKEMALDNKVQEIIGDLYCPTCRTEKCVHISTKKPSSFNQYKKCKACRHVSNNPFKDQEPTILLFGSDGTHFFPRKTSGDYDKERPSTNLNSFISQSQTKTAEPEPKMAKIISCTA